MATGAKRKGAATQPAARLTWENALAWRLGRQHLRELAPPGALLGVVTDVCGLHAQVMSSAELTAWARVDGLEPRAVGRALWEERSLVKTWAMRGTLHLLPAAELPLLAAAQAAFPPRHHAPSWLRYFGLTRAEADALLAAIPRALDGRTLTREELAEAVAELTGRADLGEKLRESWGALLKPSAFRGDLCFAPSAGQQVRFARPDQWLGTWEPVEPERAIGEVVRRYLAAYGPATRAEFARWFGTASPARAGALIERLGDEVAPVEVEGQPAWLLAEHVAEAAAARAPGMARLLPAFDHYVVAAPRDAPAVLPDAARGRVYRPQGWLSPVLLIDGRMAGVWRHERKGNRLIVEIEPFGELPPWARRAAEAEAARLAGFLGGSLALSWQT
jgi:winged helix DNA-binding protein